MNFKELPYIWKLAAMVWDSANLNISVLNEATLHTQLFDIFENPNDFFS